MKLFQKFLISLIQSDNLSKISQGFLNVYRVFPKFPQHNEIPRSLDIGHCRIICDLCDSDGQQCAEIYGNTFSSASLPGKYYVGYDNSLPIFFVKITGFKLNVH